MLIAGKYRLLYPLTTDKQPRVWAAASNAGQSSVAFKFMRSPGGDFNRRFLRKARPTYSLKGAYIAELVDLGITEEGTLFSVSSLVEGESLDKRLALRQPLPTHMAAAIGQSIARALAILHASGAAHRRLNPSKVMICNGDLSTAAGVKIIDCGIGEAFLQCNAEAELITNANDFPRYLSPEILSILPQVDHRIDIWALGVMMFEMLAGVHPFVAQTDAECIRRIVNHEAESLERITPLLDARLINIVERCLHPVVEQRWYSAETLATALGNFVEDTDFSALPTADPAEPSRPIPNVAVKVPSTAEIAASQGLAAGRVVADRYRLTRLLGQGGMGSVWAAEDVRLRRDVAIKLLSHGDEALRKRFEREAIAAARLRNPHIVTIHDCGLADDEQPYIVQDLIIGQDLRQILQAERRLSPRRVVDFAIQATIALEAIHAQDLIHRDIKPGNFISTRTSDDKEHFVLVDFGIAKPTDGLGGGVKTGTGVIVGTPIYMSPEQIQSDEEIDGRADIYALGITLYELLAGRQPFSGGSVPHVLHAKLILEPDPLDLIVKSISPSLGSIVHKCLARNKNDRFGSATELLNAIKMTPEALDLFAHRSSEPISSGPRPSRPKPTFEAVPVHSQGIESTGARASSQQVDSELPWNDAEPLQTAEILFSLSAASPEKTAILEVEQTALVPPERASDLRAVLPFIQSKAPIIQEQSSVTDSDDLSQYIEQAGLRIVGSRRDLLRLERKPGCRAPDVEIAAIPLDSGSGTVGSSATMETMAFQRKATSLFDINGSQERPVYVLVVFAGRPGAGIFRLWHELASKRHVHVLRITPLEIRLQVERGTATQHLVALLQRPKSNPFQLEGPVEREVDFFGSTRFLGELVTKLAVQCQSFGVFGLKKWGTTSFLRRLRLELADRVSAWVDIAGLVTMNASSVLAAIHSDLMRELRRRVPATSISNLESVDGREGKRTVDALRGLVWACNESSVGGAPVLFIDGIDELGKDSSCSHDDLRIIVRALYGFISVEPRAILVFAGTDDDLLCRQRIGSGPSAFDNPFWMRVDRYRVPLLDEHELGEFFRTMGALAGIHFTSEAIDRAFELTGGHKYISRLLGCEVHRQQTNRSVGKSVGPKELEQCILPLVVACDSYFLRLLSDAPTGIAEVLTRIASGPAWEPELLGLGGSLNRLQAVQFAARHGLTRKSDDGGYHLSIGLLYEWFKRNGATQLHTHSKMPSDPAPARPNDFESSSGTTVVMAGATQALAHQDRVELRKMLERCSAEELDILADNLGLTLSSVTSPGQPVPNQVLAFVRWAERTRRIDDLWKEVCEHLGATRPLSAPPPPLR